MAGVQRDYLAVEEVEEVEEEPGLASAPADELLFTV